MEAVERQCRPETLEDIAHGLDSVAGLYYPHPACPREYNEMARKGLKDLSVRIRAARDRELAKIRAAAKAAFFDAYEMCRRLSADGTGDPDMVALAQAITKNCADILGGEP